MKRNSRISQRHSPTPWFYDQVTREVSDSSGRRVASIEPRERPKARSEMMTRSNGLLAAAAPELLDTCEMCLEDARAALSGEWEPDHDGFQAQINFLERAIQKARQQR